AGFAAGLESDAGLASRAGLASGADFSSLGGAATPPGAAGTRFRAFTAGLTNAGIASSLSPSKYGLFGFGGGASLIAAFSQSLSSASQKVTSPVSKVTVLSDTLL